MDSFKKRGRGEEDIFALRQEQQFKITARRNQKVGEWAAGILGIKDSQLSEYIKSVKLSDLEEVGDQDVIRKLKKDFDESGKEVTEEEIKEHLAIFLGEARNEVLAQN